MADESSYYNNEHPALSVEREIRHDIASLELDLSMIQSDELRAVAKNMLLQKRLDLLEFYKAYGQAEVEEE